VLDVQARVADIGLWRLRSSSRMASRVALLPGPVGERMGSEEPSLQEIADMRKRCMSAPAGPPKDPRLCGK
jgi:hypothetical protein